MPSLDNFQGNGSDFSRKLYLFINQSQSFCSAVRVLTDETVKYDADDDEIGEKRVIPETQDLEHAQEPRKKRKLADSQEHKHAIQKEVNDAKIGMNLCFV